MILNGLGGVNAPSEGFRIEGQDFTNHLVSYAVQENQPSADAIQEVAVQTSNYAAEFGQAGAAVLNITMKSGTNQYHGSGYDYFVNEDLNAGDPFSVSTTGIGKYRPRNRRNDFGGTLGGPVIIPKVYDGHNKTFFFFNYEEYLESQQYGFPLTVPTPDYLNGNFSAISPNGTCSLCANYGIQQTALGIPNAVVDPRGQPIFANEIFDPTSRAVTSTGLGYASPFPNNQIPLTSFNATAIAMQKLFPAAQNANLTGNAAGDIQGQRTTTIPSVKIDQSLSDKDKISYYWSKTSTESQIASPNGNADGLPEEIGAYRGTFIYSTLNRLNYDRTLSPTTLLHLGAGFSKLDFGDHAPFLNFDPSAFALTGFEIHRQFPTVSGMCVAGPPGGPSCLGEGGMQNIGTAGQIQTHNIQEKPTYNGNVTMVRGSHTYKIGGEMYYEGTVYGSFAGVTLPTGTGPTSEPFNPTVSLNGFTTGFGYASFLLGDFNSAATCSTGFGGVNCITQTPQEDYRLGKAQYALFAQDSWKVTQKLTLDYGLRWDLGTPAEETYGRLGQFDPTAPNANAGGYLGATRYASSCNCSFYPPVYPYGIAPRLGVAYQITPKTVFRGGWGFVYQPTATGDPAGIISTTATNSIPGINPYVNIAQPGAILQAQWPVTNTSIFPAFGTTSGAPVYTDPNFSRPPRINQWSVGFQRELTKDLVIDASYVANRAVWLPSTYSATNPASQNGAGSYINQISPQTFAQYGLYPYPGTGPCSTGGGVCSSTSYNNYADYQLLNQPIGSAAVKTKLAAAGVGNGGLLMPYSGYPLSSTLKNTLYAYPQFPGIVPTGVADGASKYDSLQIKANQRFSHGLQFTGTFTWSRAYQMSPRQDFFNPNSSTWELQPTDIPFLFNLNVTYTTPKFAFLEKAKFANTIVKDWQLGAFTQYESGQLLAPPASPTGNYLSSEDYRNPGVSLYTKDLNCHCINPYSDQVLNPAAWSSVPANGVGPALGTYYSDFRGPRRPQENFNIGRNFKLRERMNLQIRGEFVNIFNRTYMPNPSTTTNPALPLTRNSFGYYTGGFGVINAYSAPGASLFTARTGTVIARLSF